MIDGLRPYAEMKQSGLPWLGFIPEGWHARRAKYSFQEVDDRSEQGDEELLSVSHKTGVTPRSQKNVTMFLAESYEGHKVCRPSDIVVNTMWAWMAAIGVSRHHGLISPAYAVYRPRSSDRFEPRYLDYLLRTETYRAEYVRRSRGITTSRLRLYPPDFLSIPLLQPPVDEQRRIVRFLDWHGAQTAKLIRAKRKSLSLFTEQLRCTLRTAVTRGFAEQTPTKPTNVPWIGDIPIDWDVSRIKAELDCLNHKRVPLSATERGRMTVRSYDYYGASGKIDRVDDFIFDDELILVAEDGANLLSRSLPLAIIARGRFWVNNHAHVLKPRRGDVRFLAALLESLNYTPWISGAAQPKLTKERMMAISIAVPSAIMQSAIMDAAELRTARVRVAIDTLSREVTLIQEYRARLIETVAFGKLDVRSIAKSLPEISPDEAEAEIQADDAPEITDDELDGDVGEAAAA